VALRAHGYNEDTLSLLSKSSVDSSTIRNRIKKERKRVVTRLKQEMLTGASLQLVFDPDPIEFDEGILITDSKPLRFQLRKK
jgi:hypothetical protein